VAGAVGGAVAIYNGYSQASDGNWAGAAYSAGTIAGGVAGGSVVGATVGDAINPPATRGFWSGAGWRLYALVASAPEHLCPFRHQWENSSRSRAS
jgi:hypothetical protein